MASVIFKTEELTTLPESGEKFVLYIVGATKRSCYIWDGTQFVQIGGSSFDPTEDIFISSERDIYIESDSGVDIESTYFTVGTDYVNLSPLYEWRKALGFAGNSLTCTTKQLRPYTIDWDGGVQYLYVFVPDFWLGASTGTVNFTVSQLAFVEYYPANATVGSGTLSDGVATMDKRGTILKFPKPTNMPSGYGMCGISGTITKSS